MRYLLIFLLFLSGQVFAGDPKPVSCGPPVKIKWYQPALFFSAQNGEWWSNSTWAGGQVPGEFDIITVSHNLTSNNRGIIIRGKLSSNRMILTFTGINEAGFVGGGMDPLPSDPGLYVMGDGQLDLRGDRKKSWTNALGSVLKGATVITVKDATGWKPGDVFSIVPTDKPLNQHDWVGDSGGQKGQSVDPFALKFERRTITAVNGNVISFAQPLVYDHLSVTSTAANKTWTAEVMNLSRSIVIEGTTTGRSHIFIRSTKPQTLISVEGRNLGPRTPGNRSGNLVTGRYGLHFHHCMDGSSGSIVEDCSFHDIGNRVYVPHFSNGITFKSNVSFAAMEKHFWWDFQDQSHRITYDGNIAALTINNGVHYDIGGFELNQGDGNSAINNVSVYTQFGDVHAQGAYIWNADSEGVWHFLNNLSHSNWSGMFVWQNTSRDHHVLGHQWYNNEVALLHGAYVNSYLYVDCIVYNSYFKVKAAPGNNSPMFERMIFDGGGQIDYLIEAFTSPAATGPNAFVNCQFKNFKKAAFLMNTFNVADAFNVPKIVDIINPDYTGQLTVFSAASVYGSRFRVQPKSGQSLQISQSGTTNIPAFAPLIYGTGTGLSAKYYNGKNFDQLAFERVDKMIKFQQWSYDKAASPNEVDYRIKPGGPFSIIEEGELETQFPGLNQYSFDARGGIRFWLDGKLLLDRWTEFSGLQIRDAATIVMNAGQKYKIRIEHFDEGSDRGFMFYQKVNGVYLNVPMGQMYPLTGPTPPPPPVPIPNRPPVVNAGADMTLQMPDSILKVMGTASDPDTNLVSVKWTVGNSNVTLTQNLSDAAHVMVKTKVAGNYTLTLTATDKLGLTASDQMVLLVLPDTSKPIPPPVGTLKADAGPDQNITGAQAILNGSGSTGTITTYRWYYDGGPLSWNLVDQGAKITVANRLANGSYVFKLRVTDNTGKISEDRVTINVGTVVPPPTVFTNDIKTGSVTCLNGRTTTYTVPKDKYSASTKAAADALALQDLNNELAKCPCQ